jgi:hypothetical protein
VSDLGPFSGSSGWLAWARAGTWKPQQALPLPAKYTAFISGSSRSGAFFLPLPGSYPFITHCNLVSGRWCRRVGGCHGGLLPWRASSPLPILRSTWTQHHRSISCWTPRRQSSSSFVFFGSGGAPGVGASWIYFLSVQIYFLFTVGFSSSPCCASTLLR